MICENLHTFYSAKKEGQTKKENNFTNNTITAVLNPGLLNRPDVNAAEAINYKMLDIFYFSLILSGRDKRF